MLPHRDSLDRGELISQSPENIVVYLEKRRWTSHFRPVWTDCWVSERPTKSRTIQVFPAPDILLRGYRRIPDESQPPCDEAMIGQRTGRFNPDINDSLTRARVHMVQCFSCSVSRFADMLDTVEATEQIEQPYSCRIRFSPDISPKGWLPQQGHATRNPVHFPQFSKHNTFQSMLVMLQSESAEKIWARFAF